MSVRESGASEFLRGDFGLVIIIVASVITCGWAPNCADASDRILISGGL